ncbi:MAG: response regulator [Alphaproteobacteria bacterium]|nr:response regulator [Alphaproteobacteria bacterium]
MAKASKILVIEDDIFVQQLVGHVLEFAGHDISLSATAAQGSSLFSSGHYDLVILDLTLPDEDGLTVARQIRSRSDVPIIVLSGRSEKDSRIAALEIGVDDYITKPTDPQELLLRVKNLLSRRTTTGPHGSPDEQLFKFDGWALNQSARTLTSPEGEDIHLTKSEFDLLAAFVRAPNRVLERDFLQDAIGRLDQPDTDRTIDVLIGRLRAKIEENPKAPIHIVTAHGLGYRFATKVGRL